MTRRYGRAPRGQRLVGRVPHGHWKTTTFVAGWGCLSVLTGSSRARLEFGSEFSVDALTGGLAGVAVLTIGLIWARD